MEDDASSHEQAKKAPEGEKKLTSQFRLTMLLPLSVGSQICVHDLHETVLSLFQNVIHQMLKRDGEASLISSVLHALHGSSETFDTIFEF
jgi:hypothetical protein